jgi:prevent-host-death family protein
MDEKMVGITELRKKWDEYIRRVTEGETITITDHNKPFARLIPAKLPHGSKLLEVSIKKAIISNTTR